jgi:queuine tRNA-ribosyltransferase
LHGVIETPVFRPGGTLGLVKSLDPRDLTAMGAGLTLANAFHLMLRPGDRTVAEFGGLHRFTGCEGAILTDSGGFQVFSLADLRKVTDEGVTFRSPIDGSLHGLSPERLVEVQENLGPDIAMVLDECPNATVERDYVLKSVDRTTAWARRALAARTREDVAWFGIVQGALFEDIRRAHAEELSELPFHGFAIGGVSVGEAKEDIERIVKYTAPLLPSAKPRYLMGVGTPEDLVRGVAAGVDMFDCVMPTRNARNGCLFTSTGRIIIKNSAHRKSELPIDENCECYTCRTFSRGFLRHLHQCKEISYTRLATLHNVWFYVNLMKEIRESLESDTFDPSRWLDPWGAGKN